MSKGMIIVLEGLDGCGKSTQLELVESFLADNNIRYRLVSFPNYNSSSGEIISAYLHGEIPCEGVNGAYAAASFYAVDRYISYSTDWKKDYDEGAVIICGRYTTSNAIYQMTKVPAQDREQFLDWLWEHEYKILGLPEPDGVLFLDMPVEVSQKLLSLRYSGDEQKKDIHERDLAFMHACRESALFAAKRCGWTMIPCSDGDDPFSVEKIHDDIIEKIKGMVKNV